MNKTLSYFRLLYLLVLISGMFPLSVFAHADPAVVSSELSLQLEADDDNAKLVLQRAEAYRASSNWTAALADYHAAEDLGLGAEVAFYRARMYLDAGDWSASIAESQRFLTEYPGNALALVVLAYGEYGAGELDAAIVSMEQH